MLRATPAPHVYSVAELVGAVDQALRERFGPLWVAGEISNLRAQPAGHVYFTLKDEEAQVRAVLFDFSLSRTSTDKFRVKSTHTQS